MRIAVATIGKDVSPYLEICDEYVIYHAENNKIEEEERVSARVHNPGYLLGKEINVIIAGSMDRGSIKFFRERNIVICINVSGDAKEIVNAYLNSEIAALAEDFMSDELHPEAHDCKYEDHDHEEC